MNPIFLETILVCVGFFLLLAEAFLSGVRKSVFGYAAILGLAGVLVLSFFSNPAVMNPDAAYFSYYSADGMAMFYKQFLLVATLCVLILAIEFTPTLQKYLPSAIPGAGVGEFYSLPLLACAGMMWMVSATDFILIFVSLELVTISFYVLVAYMRRSQLSLEAGVKYLILGALSTGFLVYGIAWIFGVFGTTSLPAIQAKLPQMDASSQMAILFALGLILIAIGFKIAAVPFQFWVPDVYQGAPSPITAFLSVASKAAGFVVLLRVLEPFLQAEAIRDKVLLILVLLSGASMVLANLAAIPQTNFKRLLAYSSVAHAGYLLMALASFQATNVAPIIAFYLSVYLLMTMLAFGVTIVVSNAVGADNISDFNGLGKRAPWLAAALTVGVLSLAGLPFTAGFFGKFFLFEAALGARLYPLVVIGAISVACGFYYYLKVIRAMYWMPAPSSQTQTEDGKCTEVAWKVSPALGTMLAVLVLATLFLGVYPYPLLALIAR